MAFTPKDWRNATTHEGGGDETTPISAAALEDQETRTTDYASLLAGTSAGIHNVKDYGAVGDGSTDDTTDIQTAATATGDGEILFFPPSTDFYKVTSPITVGDRVTVLGAATATYWAAGDTAGIATIKKTNGDTNGDSVFLVGADCVFRNMRIEAPDPPYYLAAIYPTRANNPSYGIKPSGANGYGLEVDHCTIAYFKTAGITGTYAAPLLKSSNFISNLYGVDWNAADARVTDACVFRHNIHSGYKVTNGYTTISGGCRFEWNARYGAILASSAVVSGANIFDRNGWSAIYMVSDAWSWVITGNYFRRNGGGGDSVYGRTQAITTTAEDPDGNVMYLAPADAQDKSHIRITNLQNGIVTGNQFASGGDDAAQGSLSPRYVYGLEGAIDNLTLGPNGDVAGFEASYREGAGQRIYQTGTVYFNDINFADTSGGLQFEIPTSMLTTNLVFTPTDGTGRIGFKEQSNAYNPEANQAIIQAMESPAGKTRLVAMFPTGGTIVLATEP